MHVSLLPQKCEDGGSSALGSHVFCQSDEWSGEIYHLYKDKKIDPWSWLQIEQ